MSFCAKVTSICGERRRRGAAPREIAQRLFSLCYARAETIYDWRFGPILFACDTVSNRRWLAAVWISNCREHASLATRMFALNFAREELGTACRAARRVCHAYRAEMATLDRLQGQRRLA